MSTFADRAAQRACMPYRKSHNSHQKKSSIRLVRQGRMNRRLHGDLCASWPPIFFLQLLHDQAFETWIAKHLDNEPISLATGNISLSQSRHMNDLIQHLGGWTVSVPPPLGRGDHRCWSSYVFEPVFQLSFRLLVCRKVRHLTCSL